MVRSFNLDEIKFSGRGYFINIDIQSSRKEKCEGCFEQFGNTYCTNCDKVFCKSCEDQIHAIPTNRFHER